MCILSASLLGKPRALTTLKFPIEPRGTKRGEGATNHGGDPNYDGFSPDARWRIKLSGSQYPVLEGALSQPHADPGKPVLTHGISQTGHPPARLVFDTPVACLGCLARNRVAFICQCHRCDSERICRRSTRVAPLSPRCNPTYNCVQPGYPSWVLAHTSGFVLAAGR